MQKKLILFPGIHKTASTLLQGLAVKNSALLAQRGVYCLQREKFYASEPWRHLEYPKKYPLTPTQFRQKMDELLPDHVETLVISIENLLGEPGSGYARRVRTLRLFRDAFPDRKIEVVLYLRRQDTFIESLYLQEIHLGYLPPGLSHIEKLIAQDLNWENLAKDIRTALPDSTLDVRPYEDIKKGVLEYSKEFFRSFLGDDLEGLELMASKSSNRSLSQPGLKLAELVFPYMKERQRRRQFVNFLQTWFGNDRFRRVQLLAAEQRDELRARYAESNRRLAKAEGFDEKLESDYAFEYLSPERESKLSSSLSGF